ncbi:MAG TPA: energy transducer TonB [Bacteroidetes bacterium]|nr:energy transducer TonB [Bacteroidota bacterium]
MKWKFRIRRFFDHRLVGIMGTIVFHLFMIFLFMIIQVSATYREKQDMIIVDFTDETTEEEEESIPEQEDRLSRTLSEEERFWHNIAVNQARAAREEFDLEEFIREVRRELREEGVTREENWNNGELVNQEETVWQEAMLQQQQNLEEESERNRLAELADRYTGPTNISYYLPGRDGIHLPLPIYKCIRGGTVVVSIEVDPEGRVVTTSIDRDLTPQADACLEDAALEAARKSRFSINTSAPARQQGSITYRFQEQEMR